MKDGLVEGEIVETTDEEPEPFHSPRKAALLSTFLPGAGQIYNKKYWKLPILYGGFGLAAYYLSDNLKRIDRYKTAYGATIDGDPNTTNDTGFSPTQLLTLVDQYKTWRDWSYIAIGAIYVLQIVDASVDAHLFYFDVNDDISLEVNPYFQPFGMASGGVLLTFRL